MAPRKYPHPSYERTELFDACVSLLRSSKNISIRKHLREIAALCGYREVPGEMSKVAAVKDWTAEIDWRFLK